MRIAFVCFSTSKGGLELKLIEIAQALQYKGHSILFVCPKDSPLHQACVRVNIPHLLHTPRFNYGSLPTAFTLARRFREFSIQYLIAGLSKDISTAVLIKKFHGHLRLVYFQQMQSGRDKKDFLHRWSYRRLDRWITLTHAMKQATERTTIVPPASIDVIPFGADLRAFRPGAFRPLQARRAFRLPTDKIIIGLVGRFDPQKGQEYLLQAAPTILKALPDAHFVLVGEETRGEGGFLGHPHLHPDDLLPLLESEKVTLSCGVPTIWLPMAQMIAANPGKWKLQKGLRLTVGGAAVPESMIRAYAQLDIEVLQGWGMTETSPLATLSKITAQQRHLDADARFKVQAMQGYPLPLVDVRGIGDEGEVPWDGKSVGEIQVP